MTGPAAGGGAGVPLLSVRGLTVSYPARHAKLKGSTVSRSTSPRAK